MGYGDVESQERYPHLHSPDYGYDELYSFEIQNRETPVMAG
jgi:hypothetical protein